MNKAILNQSIIAAAICAAIFTGFSFGTYYTGINAFTSFNFLYKFLPVVIVVVLILGFNLRKRLGGFISFKEALQFAFLSFVLYELVEVAVIYLLFNVIDPMLTQKVQNVTVEFMKNMLHSAGTPQAQIDKTVSDIHKQQETTGPKNLILGYGFGLIWDFVKSLLIVLVIKKERPADLDDTPQTTF